MKHIFNGVSLIYQDSISGPICRPSMEDDLNDQAFGLVQNRVIILDY